MLWRLLLGFGLVLYPAIVYVSLRTSNTRGVALVLGIFLALRLAASWRRRDRQATAIVMLPIVAVAAVVALASILNEGRLLLFVPVLINLALLATFARTLPQGPSMVEALARLQHSTLPPGGAEYCRRVTIVWCGFFTLNIAIIAGLAIAASVEAWALYTGVIAYILMGLMFAGELTYRSWRFRYYDGAATDVLFRRLFPPRTAT